MSKSENRLILALAVPAVLQTVVKSSFPIIDAFWVGKLGSVQLASVSVATFLTWGILSLGEIIATGNNALVAQTVGADNKKLSSKISLISIVNTLIYSVLLGNLIIFTTPYLYDIVNLNSEQRIYTDQFFHTFLYGLPAFLLLSTVSSSFRGFGDTRTPFYLLLSAAVLNFLINPLLVFGIEISPGERILNLGVTGSALSSVISYFLIFVVGFHLLRKKGYRDKLIDYKIDKKIIIETFRIGLPLALNGLAFSFIYLFVSRFVSDYGSVGLAALGIGHRSESLAYQMTVGFSLAATIMVGQNIGAKKPDMAERYAWKILKLSSVFILTFSAILFIFSAGIASIFSSDINVINSASMLNKLSAIVLIFSAADVILSGAFAGAGDTMPPAIISFTFNILRIPLCALLSPIWGLDGVWIAICLSVALKGIFITLWFKRGNWKKIQPSF